MKKLTSIFILSILIFAGCAELPAEEVLTDELSEEVAVEETAVEEVPTATYDAGGLTFDHSADWTADGGSLFSDTGDLKVKVALAGEIEASCFVELQAVSYLDASGRNWDYSLTMLSIPEEMEGLEELDFSGLCGDTSAISPDQRIAELKLKGDDGEIMAILSYYYMLGTETVAQIEFEAILDSLVLK